RRGRGCLCPLSRCPASSHLRTKIHCSPHPYLHRLRCLFVHCSTGGHRCRRGSHLDQHPRCSLRQDCPESFHVGEDCHARCFDRRRPGLRLEPCRHLGQLRRQPLGCARFLSHHRYLERSDVHGPVGGDLCFPVRLSLFRGLVARHHLRRR